MSVADGSADEFILSYSQMRSRATAEDSQVRNVKNWFWNHEHAIEVNEQGWLTRRSDLIPLVESRKPMLKVLLERIGASRLAAVFPATHREGRVQSKTTKYGSNRGIDATLTVVIVVVGLLALLGPMWWLSFVSSTPKRLGIITGFITIFAFILISATVNKPFEVLAGTAA